MTRDLRSMLCTCSLFGEAWREYSGQLLWDTSNSHSIFGVRSLYYNVKLTEDQRKTIEYVLGRAGNYPRGILGSYIQLPMSSGKTIIGLSVCLERVKKLGGVALCIFTEKVLETAFSDVFKLFGKERDHGILATVDGVRIIEYTRTLIDREYHLDPVVVVCSRSGFPVVTNKVHTVVCDEIHTGPASAKTILATCDNVSLVVTLTAASIGTKVKDGIRVANVHGRSLEYYGYSSTTNMNLPPVMYLIASTKKDVFYVEPNAENIESVRDRMDGAFCDWLSTRRRIGTNISEWNREWNSKLDKNSRLMAYVVDAIKLMIGRVFIITSPLVGNGEIEAALLVKFATGADIVTNLEDIKESSDIVVGTTKAFSEGVNLVKFSNVILFNPSNDPEIIRQCVGRFQRMTNDAKMISVCIITDSPSISLVSMVPRSITDTYLEERGLKKMHVDGSVNELVTPDLSVGEMVAICYKTNKKAVTHDWLRRNGMVNFRVGQKSLERVTGYRWRNVPNRSMEEAFMFYVDPETVTVDCIPMMNQTSQSYTETVSAPPLVVNDNVDTILCKLSLLLVHDCSHTFTAKELREMCSLRGLSKSGTKKQMAQRLLEAIQC